MGTTLGQLIRERRMDLGLSQEELAERIGDTVRQAEVSRLERNKIALPRRHRLEQIAAALDLSLGELLVASGWSGADGIEAKPALHPATLVDAPEVSPAPVSPPPLIEAMERAELLILRSEVAIAMAEETASRVNDALCRRKPGGQTKLGTNMSPSH